MLQNILNSEGVTVLNKKQQGSINGGQTCKITVKLSNGQWASKEFDGFSEGAAGSSQANAVCANQVSTNELVDRCFYDCSYDGIG